MEKEAYVDIVWAGDAPSVVADELLVVELAPADTSCTAKLVILLRLLRSMREDGASELKTHSGTLLWVHCLQGWWRSHLIFRRLHS